MLPVMAAPQPQWDASATRRGEEGAHLVTTRSTRILAADAAAGALLRRDVELLVQKPLAVLVDIDDRAAFRARLMQLPAGECIDDWHFRLRHPEGSCIAVIAAVQAADAGSASGREELRWTLVPDAPRPGSDEAAGSSRFDLADELRQLAHALNQPLAAIVTYVRGIQLRLDSGALTEADLRAALEIVVNEALRASGIVRELDRRWGSS